MVKLTIMLHTMKIEQERLTITLPKSMYNRLRKLAYDEDTSIATIIRQIIKQVMT